MGIEPFLLILIVAIMFVVQAIRALVERFTDRLEYARATLLGVRSLVVQQRMLPDRASGGWLTGRQGLNVQLWFDPFPGHAARRVLQRETGVRPRRVRKYLAWLAPSVLVVVRLPRPVTRRLRISPLSTVVPTSARVRLPSPVLAQLLRVAADDHERARRLLHPPEVHEPLLELLGRHPLSVVTEDTVALWCTQAIADPEPLIALAVEVAAALRREAEADRGRRVAPGRS